MEITLNQDEVTTAVMNHAKELAPGLNVTSVKFINGRGEKGLTAELITGSVEETADNVTPITSTTSETVSSTEEEQQDPPSQNGADDGISTATTVSQALDLDG